MAASVFSLNFLSRQRFLDPFGGLVFVPTCLAFLTSLLIFLYISSTSRLLSHHHPNHLHVKTLIPTKPILQMISLPEPTRSSVLEYPHNNISSFSVELVGEDDDDDEKEEASRPLVNGGEVGNGTDDHNQLPKQVPLVIGSIGRPVRTDDGVFHDREIFLENYKEMTRSLKIYVYPHRPNDPFANVLLPAASTPGGNYASEGFFKKSLMKSHYVTKNHSEADLFFLPFSIAAMRHDRRIGVAGIQGFVRDYVGNVRRSYPFWNRTGGADHFYVACHSIGKVAMDKAVEVRVNAIQVVCSSNYFVSGYVAHKDVSLPQIWPRQGDPPRVEPSKRERLAFFAGASNSLERKELIQVWRKDSEIFAHSGRLKTPYATELLKSKFCLHAKGYEVNTARIGDALFYGCVPVILADHYDLPFADVLNWKSFSVVVATADIPSLKKILQRIDADEYARLQSNALKARAHFRWHDSPIEYDAFHMVMYELWLRRSHVSVPSF